MCVSYRGSSTLRDHDKKLTCESYTGLVGNSSCRTRITVTGWSRSGSLGLWRVYVGVGRGIFSSVRVGSGKMTTPIHRNIFLIFFLKMVWYCATSVVLDHNTLLDVYGRGHSSVHMGPNPFDNFNVGALPDCPLDPPVSGRPYRTCSGVFHCVLHKNMQISCGNWRKKVQWLTVQWFPA